MIPGSFAQRRLSPPSVAAPCVWPWNERHCVRTLCRFVYMRAMRSACSFASLPPVVKSVLVRSPGVISAMSRASSARVSSPNDGVT